MASLKVGENKEINTNLIQKACSLAVKAHSKSSQKSYILEKTGGSSYVIFSFPGYWSENDWYDGEPFGETKINLDLFPSLRSIGIDEHAKVNKAFLQRFVDKISRNRDFRNEVHFALSLSLFFLFKNFLTTCLFLLWLNIVKNEIYLWHQYCSNLSSEMRIEANFGNTIVEILRKSKREERKMM